MRSESASPHPAGSDIFAPGWFRQEFVLRYGTTSGFGDLFRECEKRTQVLILQVSQVFDEVKSDHGGDFSVCDVVLTGTADRKTSSVVPEQYAESSPAGTWDISRLPERKRGVDFGNRPIY